MILIILSYFLLFLIALSVYNYSKIKYVYNLYSTYKKMIDPKNEMSHFKALKSISEMIYMLGGGRLPESNTNTSNTNSPVNAVEKFNKKLIKIPYKYKDKDYFYLLKIPKGVPPVQKIEDENGEDIFDIISPYLGPNLDCHHTKITPIDFGYSKIIVTTIYDKIITFNEEDVVSLEFM